MPWVCRDAEGKAVAGTQKHPKPFSQHPPRGDLSLWCTDTATATAGPTTQLKFSPGCLIPPQVYLGCRDFSPKCSLVMSGIQQKCKRHTGMHTLTPELTHTCVHTHHLHACAHVHTHYHLPHTCAHLPPQTCMLYTHIQHSCAHTYVHAHLPAHMCVHTRTCVLTHIWSQPPPTLHAHTHPCSHMSLC